MSYLKTIIMKKLNILVLLLSAIQIFAQNEYPVISNLTAEINNSSQIVTITYDLFDAEGEDMQVTFLVSDNNKKELRSISV